MAFAKKFFSKHDEDLIVNAIKQAESHTRSR
jgi:hypothetical protein